MACRPARPDGHEPAGVLVRARRGRGARRAGAFGVGAVRKDRSGHRSLPFRDRRAYGVVALAVGGGAIGRGGFRARLTIIVVREAPTRIEERFDI